MATANSTVLQQEHPLHDLALEATYQIEHLSLLASKVLDDSIDSEISAVKTLVDRIKSLNSLLMTSLDEPDKDPEYFIHRLGVSSKRYQKEGQA